MGSILVLMELASSGTFELFATIPFPTQVFIVGIVLLGVSILILVLSTLYRYGRNIMLKALYGKSPTPPVEPGARLFKDIIIGLLISILAILIGAIITIANSLSGGTAIAFDVNLSFAALTLGEKSLFVFGIILLFNILVLGTQFLWRNGYKYFMNSMSFQA